MYVILLSCFLLSPLYVDSFGVLYDTGFNYMTEVLLEIVSDADVEELSIETRWILQPIDHYNDNPQSWKMRYFERLDYFRSNGPVYVFLGGEGEANQNFLSAGIIQKLAQETGGAMYMTEHRYYGESKPFVNMDTENMKWLSSKQALADIANVIKSIKSDSIFERSKVVLIGGSYAGNLAAWMRLIYPDLVDAAIASSGPVLAKKDFYEYIEKVNENYEQYGTPDCLDNTRALFEMYKEMLRSPQGRQKLKQEYNICRECDLSVVKNQWMFFLSNMSPYMSYSQYGGIKKIREHCLNLEMDNSNVSIFYEKFNWNTKDSCNDLSFEGFVEYLKEEESYHAWFYQVCTEFGYFQTTSSKSQPFGEVLPQDFYLEICKDLFGTNFDEVRVDEGVENINEWYGGLTPNVTHVVFVNSDVDPWSTISVLEDVSYETPAIVIPRATHCSDLFLGRGSSEELKEAQKYIQYLIKNWIGLGDDSV